MNIYTTFLPLVLLLSSCSTMTNIPNIKLEDSAIVCSVSLNNEFSFLLNNKYTGDIESDDFSGALSYKTNDIFSNSAGLNRLKAYQDYIRCIETLYNQK